MPTHAVSSVKKQVTLFASKSACSNFEETQPLGYIVGGNHVATGCPGDMVIESATCYPGTGQTGGDPYVRRVLFHRSGAGHAGFPLRPALPSFRDLIFS
jgi:hypothetical protein